MSTTFEAWLLRIAKWSLLATVLTPLVIKKELFFPYAFSKALWFRGFVELALVCALLAFIFGVVAGRKISWPGIPLRRLTRQPLFIALAVFLVSYAVSAFFAPNAYRAFWSDVERAEGLFGMLHFALFGILSAIIFRKEEWLKYLKGSLVVGLILAFYASLEYLGWTGFPFARPAAERPGSLVGNPAFLAVGMLFMMIFAGLTALRTTSRQWRMTAAASALVATAAILLTGTRGVLLGLVFGVLLLLLYALFGRLRLPVRNSRRIAGIVLAAIVLFSGIFWTTRSASFWQSVPGLDRLAETRAFDRNDPSTETRLITWRLSWEAFKQKPVIGWGPENYLYAWEKNYDPDYAIYGETWLDRAHNKVFDLLVMQGIVGFLAYMVLFGAMLVVPWRKNMAGREVLAAGLIAYFVQNLFLFDQVISYPLFFALLGLILAETSGEIEGTETRPSIKWMGAAAGLLLTGLTVYVFYAANWVPYRQMQSIRRSATQPRVELTVEELKKAFSPYNYAQYNIRGQGVDTIYMGGYFQRGEYRDNPAFREVGQVLLDATHEFTVREPFDVRTMIREVEMLDTYGMKDPGAYVRAEEILRRALTIAPMRQEVYYHLAVNLAKQDRIPEAIDTAKHALNLSPEVARARFHYSLVLLAGGRMAESEAELDHALSIDPDLITFLGQDHNTIVRIYATLDRPEKAAALIMKSAKGEMNKLFSTDLNQAALDWFRIRRDRENLLILARHLRETDPTLREEMEVVVDLAEKDKWDLIWKL